MKKKRSLIKKSNRSGPTIEPCGTPVMIFSKLLYVLFIGTHCFRHCSSTPKIKNIFQNILIRCKLKVTKFDA